MGRIKEIKIYPSNLKVIWDNGDYSTSINYDSQQGEFTREEWREQLKDAIEDGGYGIQLDEDVEEILDALANTSKIDFFQDEGDLENG